jgi:hypothetical protein
VISEHRFRVLSAADDPSLEIVIIVCRPGGLQIGAFGGHISSSVLNVWFDGDKPLRGQRASTPLAQGATNPQSCALVGAGQEAPELRCLERA